VTEEEYGDEIDEDPMQFAANKYILPFPFSLYNDHEHTPRVSGNIFHLHYFEDEGPQINESVV
jgi:hypothetical protein